MKKELLKGSNLPSVALSKEVITVLSRLNGDEIKEIINGIRDYVYKGKSITISEDIADVMCITLDYINHIATPYLNKINAHKQSTIQDVIEGNFLGYLKD